MTFFSNASRFKSKNFCSPGPATYNKLKVNMRASTPNLNEESILTSAGLFKQLHHQRRKSMMDIAQKIHQSSTNLNEVLPIQMQPPIIVRKYSNSRDLTNTSLKQYMKYDSKLKEKVLEKESDSCDLIYCPEKTESSYDDKQIIIPEKKTKGRKKLTNAQIVNKLKDRKSKFSKQNKILSETFNEMATEMQNEINKLQEENIMKVLELRKHVDFRKALEIDIDYAGTTQTKCQISNDVIVYSHEATIKSVGPGSYNIKSPRANSQTHNIKGLSVFKNLTQHGQNGDSREQAKIMIDQYYLNASNKIKRSLSPLRDTPYTHRKLIGSETPNGEVLNKRVNFVELNKKLIQWQEKNGGSGVKASTGGTKASIRVVGNNIELFDPVNPGGIVEGSINTEQATSPDKRSTEEIYNTANFGGRDDSIQQLSSRCPSPQTQRVSPRLRSKSPCTKGYARKFLLKRKQMIHLPQSSPGETGGITESQRRRQGVLRIDQRKMGKGIGGSSKAKTKHISLSINYVK